MEKEYSLYEFLMLLSLGLWQGGETTRHRRGQPAGRRIFHYIAGADGLFHYSVGYARTVWPIGYGSRLRPLVFRNRSLLRSGPDTWIPDGKYRRRGIDGFHYGCRKTNPLFAQPVQEQPNAYRTEVCSQPLQHVERPGTNCKTKEILKHGSSELL